MRLPREQEQELCTNGFKGIHALPSVAELDDESAHQLETPLLVGGESYEFAAIANLDLFFTRVYRYWHERGLSSILLAGALNLLALAFTAAFSTFLLLFVDWRALHSECLAPRAGGTGGGSGDGGSRGDAGGCDLAAVALDWRPLLGRGMAADLLAISYISVCVVYLVWTAAHYLMDARDMREVAHFITNKLGISESKVVTMTWAEVVHKLVLVQRTTRLCIARDLDELHIVSRIMRKENYLISMINRNVLQLHLQPPHDAPMPLRLVMGVALRLFGGGGASGSGSGSGICGSGGGCVGSGGSPPMLTKTLEWNLRWCILDHMFDDRFRIRPEFSDVAALKRRLRLVAAANLILSPFLLMFLLAYFFMRNAERLYHHPAALGSRRWSGLAKWGIRELNELPHYLQHRLSASHPAALRYVAQFPSHTLAALARFMVFVTGSFVALLLLMTFLDESLLERPLLGRQVVWWLGTMTVILAACRTLVSEEPVAYDPERALSDVVSYTHYLPRYWRGRAHTAEVQAAFLSLFRLKVVLFLEELASLITTPLVLACSLPACAEPIVEFVSTFTSHVDGVGDVCSMSLFDIGRHGNVKYGAPVQVEKGFRSRQGKMEKSFLTFVATYPTWEPGEMGRNMLAALAANGNGNGGCGGYGGVPADACNAASSDDAAPGPSADALPYHQDPPTMFPYQAAAGAGKIANAAQTHQASAAALTRAASAGTGAVRTSSKGMEALAVGSGPLGTDFCGRKANSCGVGGSSSSGGDFVPQTTTTAPAAAPTIIRLPPPPHGGARFAYRRPQIPLHLLPYHGVKSYMSNASTSQLSAGGTAAGVGGGGWPWRQGYVGGTPPAGVGLAGGSPAPSVASSQFSNLPAPYLQYYPVPLFYAKQQQMRHVQQKQQQYRRMYEQLMYGVPSPRGSEPLGGVAAAAMAAAAGNGWSPPPLSPPYTRQMATSSASLGPPGVMDWRCQSLPQPFDVCGSSYSGYAYNPYPFQGSPPMSFPQSPTGHLFGRAPPYLPPPPHPTLRQPQFHSIATVSAGGSVGAQALRLPMTHGDADVRAMTSGPDAPRMSASCIGSGNWTANGAAASVGPHPFGRRSEPTASTPPPQPLPPGQPCSREVGPGQLTLMTAACTSRAAVASLNPLSTDSCWVQGQVADALSTSAVVAAGRWAGSSVTASRAGFKQADAVGEGWGGVSVLSEHRAGDGSSRWATAVPTTASASSAAVGTDLRTIADVSAAEKGAASNAADPINADAKGSGAACSGFGSGSGSGTAMGSGSDVLDLRGFEGVRAVMEDDNDDPLGLGAFISLPPPPPSQAGLPAVRSSGTDRGQLEDADGFGLVPQAASSLPPALMSVSGGVSASSGLMPRRWGPEGSVASSRLAPESAGGGEAGQRYVHQHQQPAAAVWSDTVYGGASGAWYEMDGLYSHQQQLRQQQWQPRPSELSEHSAQCYERGFNTVESTTQQQQMQQQQQPEDAPYVMEPSSSQMYYSTDYYATSPYYGIDEYAMYGYESAGYDDGAAAAGTAATASEAWAKSLPLHPVDHAQGVAFQHAKMSQQQ